MASMASDLSDAEASHNETSAIEDSEVDGFASDTEIIRAQAPQRAVYKPPKVDGRVRLFCRIRPTKKNALFVVDPEQKQLVLEVPDDKRRGDGGRSQKGSNRNLFRFKFHRVLDMDVTQQEVFEVVARQFVHHALDGYNGTIFCYGPTSTGKTHTMMGHTTDMNSSQRGLIPRFLIQLFNQSRASPEQTTIKVSFLEIYQEKAYDLLDQTRVDNNSGKGKLKIETLKRVQILSGGGNTVMKNLTVKKVDSEKKAIKFFLKGQQNRIMCETELNDVSSRSHCVFTIYVNINNGRTVRKSKVHLVDLAGSERVRNRTIGHQVLSEAQAINLSLHYLEHVIVALQEKSMKKKKKVHIPYRNSTLTSILQGSLGGNCVTAMIATMSMRPEHIPETISTCRFAQRLLLIKNSVKRNEELASSDPRLAALMKKLKKGGGGFGNQGLNFPAAVPLTSEERLYAARQLAAWIQAGGNIGVTSKLKLDDVSMLVGCFNILRAHICGTQRLPLPAGFAFDKRDFAGHNDDDEPEEDSNLVRLSMGDKLMSLKEELSRLHDHAAAPGDKAEAAADDEELDDEDDASSVMSRRKSIGRKLKKTKSRYLTMGDGKKKKRRSTKRVLKKKKGRKKKGAVGDGLSEEELQRQEEFDRKMNQQRAIRLMEAERQERVAEREAVEQQETMVRLEEQRIKVALVMKLVDEELLSRLESSGKYKEAELSAKHAELEQARMRRMEDYERKMNILSLDDEDRAQNKSKAALLEQLMPVWRQDKSSAMFRVGDLSGFRNVQGWDDTNLEEGGWAIDLSLKQEVDHLPPDIGRQIRQLHADRLRAIELEDYDEAKRIKYAIEDLVENARFGDEPLALDEVPASQRPHGVIRSPDLYGWLGFMRTDEFRKKRFRFCLWFFWSLVLAQHIYELMEEQRHDLYWLDLFLKAVSFLSLTLFCLTVRTWTPCELKSTSKFQDFRTIIPDPRDTVDIIITTYKEPISVVLSTVLGAIKVIYPPEMLHVYVLDDGERVALEQKLAEIQSEHPTVPLTYVTRTEHVGAKGGNVNNGLRHTRGKFFVVLDCDMVPKPDLLNVMMEYYYSFPADYRTKIAYIQTPQTFGNFNANTDYFNFREQLFYQWMVKAASAIGTCPYVGTGALFRKQSLEEIGGFHMGHATEDTITGCLLHQAGWKSHFLDRHIAEGICPNSLPDVIDQRVRWVQGGVQMFFDEMPFLKSTLTWSQRVFYFQLSSYWFFGILMMVHLARVLVHMGYFIFASGEERQELIEAADSNATRYSYISYWIFLIFMPELKWWEGIRCIQMFLCFVPVYFVCILKQLGFKIKVQATVAANSDDPPLWHPLMAYHVTMIFLLLLATAALFYQNPSDSANFQGLITLLIFLYLFAPVFRSITNRVDVIAASDLLMEMRRKKALMKKILMMERRLQAMLSGKAVPPPGWKPGMPMPDQKKLTMDDGGSSVGGSTPRSVASNLLDTPELEDESSPGGSARSTPLPKMLVADDERTEKKAQIQHASRLLKSMSEGDLNDHIVQLASHERTLGGDDADSTAKFHSLASVTDTPTGTVRLTLPPTNGLREEDLKAHDADVVDSSPRSIYSQRSGMQGAPSTGTGGYWADDAPQYDPMFSQPLHISASDYVKPMWRSDSNAIQTLEIRVVDMMKRLQMVESEMNSKAAAVYARGFNPAILSGNGGGAYSYASSVNEYDAYSDIEMNTMSDVAPSHASFAPSSSSSMLPPLSPHTLRPPPHPNTRRTNAPNTSRSTKSRPGLPQEFKEQFEEKSARKSSRRARSRTPKRSSRHRSSGAGQSASMDFWFNDIEDSDDDFTHRSRKADRRALAGVMGANSDASSDVEDGRTTHLGRLRGKAKKKPMKPLIHKLKKATPRTSWRDERMVHRRKKKGKRKTKSKSVPRK